VRLATRIGEDRSPDLSGMDGGSPALVHARAITREAQLHSSRGQPAYQAFLRAAERYFSILISVIEYFSTMWK
jgi:hypothetical protein